MFLAWRYGGADPYVLRNGGLAPPAPKRGGEDCKGYRFPVAPHRDYVRYARYRNFIMGCGLAAFDMEKRFAGAKQRQKVGRALGG